LIRTRSLQPELEYIFKHALTQEVVYNGILKKERKEIHERIARVMEQLFTDRLSEFYETLAFHFKQGMSIDKAVDYLMKAGEKSLKRYALEESHQYYKEAFDLLSSKRETFQKKEDLLIDLIIRWALVFYYRGDFKGLTRLLSTHEDLAKSLDDRAMLGMFYAWYGFTLCCRERFKDSYKYITSALQIGEEIENQQVIGYACAWLTWTCLELGFLEEALIHGERAQEIYRVHEPDQYLYVKSLGGLGITHWYRGDRKKTFEAGKALMDFGHKYSNIRSLTMGHNLIGCSYFMDGDFLSAIEWFRKTIQVSADPVYSEGSRAGLGMSHLLEGQFQEAESPLRESADFAREFGFEVWGAYSEMGLAVIQIAKGNITEGFKKLEECQRSSLENERRYFYARSEHILGKLYSQIAMGEGGINASIIIKNIGFFVKTVPLAKKKAETHFCKAIEASKEIGAKGLIGQANLDIGFLHKAKGKNEIAKECITEAVQVFEQCEADVLLKQAKEALASLE
jgi:tetratricopeptide (TPR) repeat protein